MTICGEKGSEPVGTEHINPCASAVISQEEKRREEKRREGKRREEIRREEKRREEKRREEKRREEKRREKKRRGKSGEKMRREGWISQFIRRSRLKVLFIVMR